MNNIKYLFEIYEKWSNALIENETLFEALEKVPEDTIVASLIMPTGQGLPPTRNDTSVGDRKEEIKRDLMILNARVEAIGKAIIKELSHGNPTSDTKEVGQE